MKFLTRSQLAEIPATTPLIDTVIDKGTVSMLVAEPACYKSFLAIDWACCYATGKAWQGHTVHNKVVRNKVQRPGQAFYIAAEGARGIEQRVKAWEHAWGTAIPDKALIVAPEPVQLGDYEEVEKFIFALRQCSPGLIVLDTVARCCVGLEENSARDMGRVIDAAYRIRAAMGDDCTVLLVHHAGKNGSIRGSSALLGGVDQVLRLTREGNFIELKDEKRKDGEELAPMSLQVRPAMNSLVIESASRDTRTGTHLLKAMRDLTALGGLTKTDLKAAAGLPDTQFFRELSAGITNGDIETSTEKTPRYLLSSKGKTSVTSMDNKGHSVQPNLLA